MDIRSLQYFLAIARDGSLTSAANTLHISQPALSRQVKELEDEIGKKLFHRQSRGISLTDDGLLLRKRAEEIVDLLDKTKSELSGNDESISGDVYIGAGEAESIHFLTNAARSLRNKYPAVRFHITSGNTTDALERLSRGLIDFALIVSMTELDERKYGVLPLPAEERWGVLMPADHPLAKKKTVSQKDIAKADLIISNELLTSPILSELTSADAASLNIIATYSLLFNASIMVRDGLGLAIALDGIINTEGSGLAFRPFRPRKTVGMSLVWKRYQVFSKSSAAYLAQLRQLIESNMD